MEIDTRSNKLKHKIIICLTLISGLISAQNIEVNDKDRNRMIPTELYYPLNASDCTIENKCSVVILGAGYGVPHTSYTFLTDVFNKQGYLVVAIRHELPSDPLLSRIKPFIETRSENWKRGAESLKVAQKILKQQLPAYNFDSLLLIGHSNGGDISALLGNEGIEYINTIITLDHRRVPLPRTKDISILSIRASDFEADNGVLPSKEEQKTYGDCIVKIPNSRHNDMTDDGEVWLKQRIQNIVVSFMSGTVSCKNI